LSDLKYFSIRDRIDSLAEEIVNRQYTLQPEIWKPYGSSGRQKSVRDARYHLEYLSEAINTDAPELFLSYLGWVKVLFSSLHFPDSVLQSTLECTRWVLEKELHQEKNQPALNLLDQSLRSINQMPTTLDSIITGNEPLDMLARRYLEALLNGDRASASQMIMQQIDKGVPIKDIYLYVFQRVQHEIGRLWQINQISVAQEHYCSAATQLIMSQLYPLIFASEKKKHSLVAACVGGELHEIGARMVADFLEMDGWDTYYIGANSPSSTILQTISDRKAKLLAVSVTMTYHLPLVQELIDQIRTEDLDIRIMVGGYPFNQASDLWMKIGADGYAPDAQKASLVAERLLN